MFRHAHVLREHLIDCHIIAEDFNKLTDTKEEYAEGLKGFAAKSSRSTVSSVLSTCQARAEGSSARVRGYSEAVGEQEYKNHRPY